MGGFFGVASKQDCVLELFYGVDYHSHHDQTLYGMENSLYYEWHGKIHPLHKLPFLLVLYQDVSDSLLRKIIPGHSPALMLVMTKEGIYGARDRYGRTPLVIGKKDDSYCLSFESHAYINLGYTDYKELGPCTIDSFFCHN